MNMPFSRIMIACAAFGIAPLSAATHAAGFEIVQLTDNSTDDKKPVVNSKGQVVWETFDGIDSEVMLYDGTNTIPLTDNNTRDELPHINSSGRVVWQATISEVPTIYEIFYYDGTTTSRFTNNNTTDLFAQISDRGDILWWGNGDNTLYDGKNVITLNSALDPSLVDNPGIMSRAGHVVWHRYQNGVYSLYRFDGRKTEKIGEAVFGGVVVDYHVNNHGQVVWNSFDGNDYELFMYDRGKVVQLTNNDYFDGAARINHRENVAWVGGPSTSAGVNYSIFMYDGKQVTVLPDISRYEDSVSINSRNHIVWQAWIGGNWEIVEFDGETANVITHNDKDDTRPEISDSGTVVWTLVDGLDTEIMLAKPIR